MKLFPKLALMVSVLLIGTTFALSLSFYVAERRSIRTQADQERRALLQNLVHIAQESFLTNDDLLLVKYTRWLQKWNPSLESASVADIHGEVLAHSEPSQIGKSLSPTAPDADPRGALVLTQPVHLGNQWVATASASFSERQCEEAVESRLIGLKRRLGEIAQGNYTLHLAETSRRRDELGFLSKSFQFMAQELGELDRMKEDFVSTVTHELRSPLGAIE